MTATNHGLFGAVIAISLQKYPAVAIAIAPFSHFLLDSIPHFADKGWDLRGKTFLRFLVFDCILAVISTLLIAFVWRDIALLVIACAFLSASPDLMWIYYEYVNPKLRKVHILPRFHSWIQWSETRPGMAVEVVWFMVLFPGLIYVGVY